MPTVRCPCCGASFSGNGGLSPEGALGLHLDAGAPWCKQWMLSSSNHRQLAEQSLLALQRSLKPPRGQAGNR